MTTLQEMMAGVCAVKEGKQSVNDYTKKYKDCVDAVCKEIR